MGIFDIQKAKIFRLFVFTLILSATFLSIVFLSVKDLKAGQAKYIYDDLGRLSQVIDDLGNVTTYTYDAVGNLLSITTSTGGIGAPTIASVTPNSVNAGTTVSLSVSGTNLQGATLFTDNPGITFSNVRTAAASISADMTLSPAARNGATTLTVYSAAGSAVTTLTVSGVALALNSLNPTSGPVTRVVTLTGTGFSATPSLNTVQFNGVSATVYTATATSLKVAV